MNSAQPTPDEIIHPDTSAREAAGTASGPERSAHFRALADAIPQIVWTADAAGWTDYCNARWFAYTGMTLDATEGAGWQRAVHPEDLARTTGAWSQARASGEPLEIEHRLRRGRDGAYRWHLTRAAAARGEDGAIVKWFGTCTDIDDQKRPDGQERFRIVADALPDGFTVLRPLCETTDQTIVDFQISYANPVATALLTVDSLAPVGRTLLDIFPQLQGSALLAGYVRTWETGEPFRIEHEFGPAESRGWASVTVIRVEGELVVTNRDATARHVAEAVLEQANVVLEERASERAIALHESEERYRTVLAATPDGVVLQHADFSIGAWNAAAERLTGLTEDQAVGRAPRPQGWEALREDGSRYPLRQHPSLVTLRTGVPQIDQIMGIRRGDGTVMWISMNTMPLIHAGANRPYAAITSFADVTARRATEAALRESEQRFALLALQAPVGIFRTDELGACTFVNQKFCTLTGMSAEEAKGFGWLQMVHPEDRTSVFAEWDAAIRQARPFRLEYRLVTAGGETLWVEGSAEAIRDAGNAVCGYIGSLHDISERRRKEDTLRVESLRDELTGLFNRRGFLALAEHEWNRARRYRATLLIHYMDVDQFKAINDTFGHEAGDDALRAVAATLLATGRDTDVTARLGGDEFVTLSVHASVEVAAVAERAMRARVAAHLSSLEGKHAYDIAISTGAAMSGEPLETVAELIAAADREMYESKRRRKGDGGV